MHRRGGNHEGQKSQPEECMGHVHHLGVAGACRHAMLTAAFWARLVFNTRVWRRLVRSRSTVVPDDFAALEESDVLEELDALADVDRGEATFRDLQC